MTDISYFTVNKQFARWSRAAHSIANQRGGAKISRKALVAKGLIGVAMDQHVKRADQYGDVTHKAPAMQIFKVRLDAVEDVAASLRRSTEPTDLRKSSDAGL